MKAGSLAEDLTLQRPLPLRLLISRLSLDSLVRWSPRIKGSKIQLSLRWLLCGTASSSAARRCSTAQRDAGGEMRDNSSAVVGRGLKVEKARESNVLGTQ